MRVEPKFYVATVAALPGFTSPVSGPSTDELIFSFHTYRYIGHVTLPITKPYVAVGQKTAVLAAGIVSTKPHLSGALQGQGVGECS